MASPASPASPGLTLPRRVLLPVVVAVVFSLIAASFGASALAFAEPTDETTQSESKAAGGSSLGDGAYEMTGTVFGAARDGLVGKQTSSGFELKGDDELVALPACTESSCPWLDLDEVAENWGKQTDCAEPDGLCWVEIVSDETDSCVVAPVRDVGPLFTNDNWWADADDRTYDLERGRTAADVVVTGGDVGFGAGNSNTGFDVDGGAKSAPGIDLGAGTAQALGLDDETGSFKLTVRLLWQAGISHEEACPDSASAANAANAANAIVTDELNLREAPSTDAEILDVIPDEAEVTVTGAGRNGFYPVQYKDRAGWVSAKWLQAAGATGSAADAPLAITTERLNLRAGPSTADKIVSVIPRGGLVTLAGGGGNGFVAVIVDGVEGYAYAAFLRGGSPPSLEGATVRTTDELNQRAGPTTDDRILATLAADTEVTLTGKADNGFLAVVVDDVEGWVAAEFLSGFPEATTSTRLFLRPEPSVEAEAINAIPANAKVQLLGADENGFLPVAYNGQQGYVYAAYLT